jgi:hypothetical protein
MNKEKYYGCENPEAVSYLEFGSINLVKGEKKIWNYWQDQEAYDLYMFARYARDLFAFRKFFDEPVKNVSKLQEYVKNAAHNKLLDYIFKYAGMIAIEKSGGVCESGSSLFGWIDEAKACDYVFHNGENISKIDGFDYVCSDMAEMMNEGAASFHSNVSMCSSTEDTISGLFDDVKDRLKKNIDLFYGVSVSIRYAVRNAADLVKAAENSKLSIYNRLSLTYDDKTLVNVYGTGKAVYIVSLKELREGLAAKGLHAYYCTANMQYNKDGENTVRASVIISESEKLLERFMDEYNYCVEKSIEIEDVEKGEWKKLSEL